MRDYAATALKCVAVIFWGIGCQRMAIAMAPDTTKPGDAAGILVPSLPPSSLRRIRIAQADDTIPETQETAPADVPASPPVVAPESLSVDRQFSPKHRRRRPKMAGVPSGTQTAAEPPESAPTQQVAQGAATAATPAAQQPGVQQPAAQEANKTGASVAAGEAETVEVPETEGANAPGAIAAAKAEKEQQGLFARKYRLAPIKWNGTITESLGYARTYFFAGEGVKLNPFAPATQAYTAGGSYGTMQQMQTVMVGGDTFVIQPWIATVRGRFGVAKGQNITAGVDSHLNGLIGAGEAQLFNRSRFPVVMGYASTDSRSNVNDNGAADNSITIGDTVRKKLVINNAYRSLDWLSKSEATYVRDNVTTESVIRSPDQQLISSTDKGIDSTLSGSFSTKLGPARDQPFFLTGSHSVYSGSTSYTGASLTEKTAHIRTDSIAGNHLYTPEDSLLTLRTNGNYLSSDADGNKVISEILNTNATWQPEAEDNPLIVRGGAKVFNLTSDTPTTPENREWSLSSNVLLTYNAWRDRRLSGGAMVAETNSGGVSTLATTEFARGDYLPSATRFGKNIYTQVYNAGFLNQTTGGSPSDLNVYAGATHSLVAPYKFNLYGYDSTVRSSFSQTLNVQHDQINGASEILTTRGDVNWQPSLHKRLLIDRSQAGGVREATAGSAAAHAVIGVRVYDTHTFGYGAGHSDAVTFKLGLSGLGGFMSRAAGYGATGDLSINTMYQNDGNIKTNAVANAAWGWGTQYNYVYKKPRAFGVRGLDYGLIVHLSGNTGLAAQRAEAIAAGVPRTGGTESGYLLNYGASIKQNLRYRIGQNEALLTTNLSASYGVKNASLMLLFRAWRNFGN